MSSEKKKKKKKKVYEIQEQYNLCCSPAHSSCLYKSVQFAVKPCETEHLVCICKEGALRAVSFRVC